MEAHGVPTQVIGHRSPDGHRRLRRHAGARLGGDEWPELCKRVREAGILALHCAVNVLYRLQHLGHTIPPQANAGWIGETSI